MVEILCSEGGAQILRGFPPLLQQWGIRCCRVPSGTALAHFCMRRVAYEVRNEPVSENPGSG